jgi:hypothetical protein
MANNNIAMNLFGSGKWQKNDSLRQRKLVWNFYNKRNQMWQNFLLKVWGKKKRLADSLVSEAFSIRECLLEL